MALIDQAAALAIIKNAEAQIAALPDLTPPPCPDPVPPQPTPGNLTPSLGVALRTLRCNWMADWIDLSKLPPPQPYVMWGDASKGIIAPAQKGVVATSWISLPIWGQRGIEYLVPPIVVNGVINRYDPRAGDVVFQDDTNWGSYGSPKRVYGQRGSIKVSPYSTWCAHPTLDASGNPIPRAPCAVGIEVDGSVDALFLLDSAGKPNPYYAWLGQIKIAPTEGTLDIALNLANRKIFFVAVQQHDGSGQRIPVAGRVIKVDRTAAIAAGLPENSALWVQTDLATGLGAITSVTCQDDGTAVYACDVTKGAVYRIDTATGAVTAVLSIPKPFFVRRTSTSDGERLIVLDQFEAVHVVGRDGSGHQVIRKGGTGLINFGALDVDRNGSCGAVNDIGFLSSHMDSGEAMRFLTGPNWATEVGLSHLGFGGQSYRTVGDVTFQASPIHYPWWFVYLLDQGFCIGQGFGNTNPFALRPRLSSDPSRENFLHGVWGHGYNVAAAGPSGHEMTKPSFHCQMAPNNATSFVDPDFFGNMKLPNGEPDFASMLAWFQRGGLGEFPRPELTGYDAYSLLYWALADSQLLAQEGDPLLGKLTAFFGSAASTATPNPSWPGSQYSEQAKHISVHLVGTNLVAQAIDAYGVILTIDPACLLTCFVDELMPGQISVGTMNAANQWTLPAPTVSKGQHVVSCHVTSGQADHLGEAAYWTV